MRGFGMLAAVLALAALGALAWRVTGERSREPSIAPRASEPAAVETIVPMVPAPTQRAELPAGSAASSAPFVARVVSVATFARDAERIGHVSFRVYAQRPAAGDVADRSRQPLPLAPGDEPLFEGRTDAQGEARVELVLAHLSADSVPLLCARVVEPGFQQQVGLGRATRGEGDVPEIRLVARRGATARGRVFDAAGRAASARVDLARWDTSGGVRRLSRKSEARALADGWFELHFERAVEDGILIAEAGPGGSAALTGLSLALESPPQDLELVLRGEGVLRGRLVDRAGAPAPGVEVLVLLAELDDGSGSSHPPEPAHSERQLEGLGRARVQLLSERDGSFEVRGLRAEAYALRARWGEDSENYAWELTPEPVLADGRELVLRVARPHVLVRLLDVEGRPSVPSVANAAELRDHLGRLARWPQVPTVRVFESGSSGGARLATLPVRGKVLPTGECVFDANEGARYLVCVQGPGFDGVPREVELAPGEDRAELELRARELGELGTVAVRVFHQGVEQRGSDSFLVRLEHPGHTLTLASCNASDGAPPYLLRAPPGPYRVVVEGETWFDGYHGYVVSARTLGRSETGVELRAGLTQEVALEIDAGGSLEVRLEGVISEADVATLAEAHWLDADQKRREAAKARLQLERPGRAPESLEFEEQFGPEGWAKFMVSTWPLGETHVSARLPTGRYVLVARLPGGREARAEVELRAGETTAVTLRF